MIEESFDEASNVTCVSQPDYDAIDRSVFGAQNEQEGVQNVLEGVRLMLHWICQGDGDKARSVRLQAVRWSGQFSDKNQEQLGREIGVGKAAVNQKISELRAWIDQRSGRDLQTRGARTVEAKQKFSEICKSNHEKRKNQSIKSPMKSGRVSPTPSDLVQKYLQEAAQCAHQLSAVAQHSPERNAS